MSEIGQNESPNNPLWETVVSLTAQGVIGAIPLVGAIGSAGIAQIFQARSSKRLEDFLAALIARINDLEKKGLCQSFEECLKSQTFNKVLVEAMNIAQRNALGDKLKALESGVVNTSREGQNVDLRLMFLRYVEELTLSHLQLLEFLNAPKTYFEKHDIEWADYVMGGKNTIIREAFPEWENYFSDQLINDLNSKGLVGLTTQHGITTASGMAESSTTTLGKTFMIFISEA